MSTKEKHNPVRKYLPANEFIEYCKANNIDTSLNDLEAYDKVGLLNPVYRFVKPDEYVRTAFEYNHRRLFNPHSPFEMSDKWEEITRLMDSLSSYAFPQSSHLNETLKNGHPLDFAWRKKNPFLHKPSLTDFRPWTEYDIVAGTIDGHPIKETTVEHYYAPWQIFILSELNSMHTIEENYATGYKIGWGILKREIHPSKLLEYSELFQTISNFRMKESLIWIDMTSEAKKPIIEGELLEKIITRTAGVAKEEYENHSHAEWINSVRKSVQLYKEYLEKEKIKLSNELKTFLTNTIIMIMDATQKPFEEISDEYDGKFKGHRTLCLDGDIVIYPGALEQIYPDELKQAKERSLWIIEGYIRQFNEILPDDDKIQQKVKDDLIDSIIESSHDVILAHLHQIQKLWFNHGPHWKSSIWAHIRSFAVSMESIGKEWYKGEHIGDFENLLKKVFKKDYTRLTAPIGGNKIIGAKTPNDYKQNLDKILEHSKKNTVRICGYHLAVANLTRNYLSHNVKFEPDMLGSKFVEVYKDLVLTLISLFVETH